MTTPLSLIAFGGNALLRENDTQAPQRAHRWVGRRADHANVSRDPRIRGDTTQRQEGEEGVCNIPTKDDYKWPAAVGYRA